MVFRRVLSLALAASALSFAGCAGGGHGPVGSVLPQSGQTRQAKELVGGGPASVSVALYDAPLSGAGLSVNVGLDSIALVDASGNVSPIVQYSTPSVVNLLSLQQTALAIQGQVSADTYASVQITLDPSTSQLTLGSLSLPLFPNAGAPVVVNSPLYANVQPGASISITLDFNLVQSLLFQGNRAAMQPIVYAAINAGNLSGTVVNGNGQAVPDAVVSATDANGNVDNVTVTNANGAYTLHALSAGTYTISVNNTYTNPLGRTFTAKGADAGAAPSTSATVVQGQTTTVGTLTD